MFFVFYILILTFTQASNINSASVPPKISNDGKKFIKTNDNFKFKDNRHAASTPTNFQSLFHFMQNHTFTKSTTKNLKSNEFDKMLSDEMFSMKQLLYNKDKLKMNTPALEIKQKWPVIELLKKLNKNNNLEDSENLVLNILGNNSIVNDSRDLHKELENIQTEDSNSEYDDVTSEDTMTSSTTTSKETTTTATEPHLSSTRSTFVYKTIADNVKIKRKKIKEQPLIIHINKEKQSDSIKDKPSRTIRDGRTVEAYDDTEDEEWEEDNEGLELKSIHGGRKSVNDAQPQKKPCTCSERPEPGSSIRCTANALPDENAPTHECTARQPPVVTNTPNPFTTCFTIFTTNMGTTCYPLYQSTVATMPTYGAASYYYQPYPMFVEVQQPQSGFEWPVKKLQSHKSKRYKENMDKSYYDEKYDEYLVNDLENLGTMISTPTPASYNECKDIALKDDECKCKGCTRDYEKKKDDFVNEVVSDLRKFHAESVIKSCYCHGNNKLSGSAIVLVNNLVTLVSAFIFLICV